MLPPSSQGIFKQFEPTKLYSFPLNIPLSSFSMSWREQTRKEKKKSYLLTVPHAACGIPQTHQSVLVQMKLSKATLKPGVAGIHWMFIFNRKHPLHGLTTHLLQDNILHYYYFHVPFYRPHLCLFTDSLHCRTGKVNRIFLLSFHAIESSFPCYLIFFCVLTSTFRTEKLKLRTEEMSVK